MKKRRIYSLALLAGDLVALYAGLLATILVKYPPAEFQWVWDIHLAPFSIVFSFWILIFFIAGLYEQEAWATNTLVRERLIKSMAASIIVAALLFYLVPAFGITPKTNLLVQSFLSFALIMGWRMLFSSVLRSASKTNVLFLGVSPEVIAFAEFLNQNPQLGYTASVLMHTDETALPATTIEIAAPTSDLGPIIKHKKITLVVASQDIKSRKEFVRMLYNLLPTGVTFADFPTFYENLTGKIPTSLISEIWFLENLAGGKKRLYEISKRASDIIIAIGFTCGIILILPFIAVGIILSTPREIIAYKKYRARSGDGILFFRQQRVGRAGKTFYFAKFRSQRLGAERMSEVKSAENDQRQYPFGRLLRACYLDELPQVWNVLKGEMSFVGPRPERPEYVARLKEEIPFYEMRLLVPPGITGWAQVSMKNDASVEDAPEKMQYDLYYIKNRSFALDMTILLKTFFVMISRGGR
ncbi:MAG: hypothetical protein A3C84_00135 [Candidatus Ryanbacteria bacterium RIFCSPHIGHO2_02_FULL_48_12]|uniref:Bacterial sugar transferase domain-containing protein n=1 Tax=Candidatus Ryanbacteria bacterium RIFCSPHIGHO2_01_FULL_48_27 TaxID=1802115 RepID=A0A1G2G5A9_9BACT|nr:MAG: hypothetical protein A2756_00305 [Candidatus Ryanbacteria bacterium RIFCSPHIGHO2_01_FULL_48_27]OGZ50385.1 MAG: hypothetical protein A3C84_00135 [Candidatus Ryanbacteria bacterium RIFCSPHIGHO2_02_FULL_48_12]